MCHIAISLSDATVFARTIKCCDTLEWARPVASVSEGRHKDTCEEVLFMTSRVTRRTALCQIHDGHSWQDRGSCLVSI